MVAPEAGLGLRWRGRRAELNARYAWSYQSLGPRIGYGQAHTATLRLTAWPFDRPSLRESSLRVVLRARHGAEPLATDPPLATPGTPPLPLTATLVATTLAARATLELPVARGWSLIPGVDLLFARGRFEGAPPIYGAQQELTATFTIGLAATVSTDKRRLAPRAPGLDEDEAARRGASSGEPGEDRTRFDEGRTAEP